MGQEILKILETHSTVVIYDAKRECGSRLWHACEDYLVNLERVAEIRARSKGEYEVRLEPPVNKVLPVSRNRYSGLRKLLGL